MKKKIFMLIHVAVRFSITPKTIDNTNRCCVSSVPLFFSFFFTNERSSRNNGHCPYPGPAAGRHGHLPPQTHSEIVHCNSASNDRPESGKDYDAMLLLVFCLRKNMTVCDLISVLFSGQIYSSILLESV